MIKTNDKITYIAQRYTNAETSGLVDDTVVFVPYMIVGESATVRVNYAKKGVAYADVVQLTEQSPQRVPAPCPHFGKCGGCSLMHMNYSEQLLFKRNKVATNLAKIGKLNVDVLPCAPSLQVLGYRNKLSLPIGGSVGNVKIGMYRRGSHKIVDMDNCLLGGSWAVRLVELFRQYLNQNNVLPYNEQDFSGEVRHLVARYVDGQIMVTVVSNGKFNHDLTPFAKMLCDNFDHFGLFVNENTQKNNVILGKITKHVCGLRHIVGKHCGVSFTLRPNSFFQINNDVKDGIYAKVKQLLDTSNTQVLLECFSGIGILTNVLASPNYHTYAMEIEPSAVSDANDMARYNHSPNVTNLCGDVKVLLPQLVAENRGKVMSLVVDPPRKGLGEEICQTILDAQPNNVVYVSCDSATLARDLAQLTQGGYTVQYVEPWDMFPNTDQVETVCHLTKNN